VHPTGGIRTAKKGVNYAQTNSVKSTSSHPAHQRVTQTVRQPVLQNYVVSFLYLGFVIEFEFRKASQFYGLVKSFSGGYCRSFFFLYFRFGFPSSSW
jgi:hypothetical protein